MKHSKQTINFADNLIYHCAHYDKIDHRYDISLSDLCDVDKYALTSFILAENDSCSSEAIGPDNKNFYKSMLPSLISYMKNISDKDRERDFVDTWNEGLANYVESIADDLLQYRLSIFNSSRAA